MNSLCHCSLPVRRSPGSSACRLLFGRSRAGVAAVLVSSTVLACGGDDDPGPVAPPPPAPVATTVEVAPATADLTALGQTVQLTATVRDQNGGIMSGASVTWTSGDAAVATVDAAGLVTAVATGAVTINAASGSASGSASVTVTQAAAQIAVTPDSLRLTALAEQRQLTAEAFDANGNAIVDPMLNWASEDDAVATVDAAGLVTAVANGETTVTATSGSASASVAVTVTSQAVPAVGPPAPTHAADSVISLFSDAYDDVPVDTWSADWDAADLTDVEISGDPARLYTNLSFAGIEFTSDPVDVTGMDYFRMDVWTPDETALPAAFKVKLVDFGADGAFEGGDDSEHEATITVAEGLASGEWVQLDLWLDDFTNLASRANLAQLIISGSPNTVYVDNVYFRQGAAPPSQPEPTEPAPTPQDAADGVISLFSDAYDDVAVDTWSASWDQAEVEDVEVSGDAVKKYTGLTFAGIEFTSATLDASDMTHFRLDIWTPDETAAPAAFRVKLVDFGADGAFGGGDDSEHEATITAAEGLATGAWVSLDLSLADFANLASREHLAQLIISGDPNTVYVDNVYFRSGEAPPAPEAPSAPAPVPDRSAEYVISLFSDAYADASVDTWSASWDQADVEDVAIEGDTVKKYTNLTFAGIEFTSQTIDAESMTHLHFDIWTPDPTDDPAAFRVKLVDFGADGAFGGGDDAEHEVALTAGSDPALQTGRWVSYDLALSDMTALTARGHVAQLIISGDPNTVFLDNIYFFEQPATAPSEPAPVPSHAADSVISFFSDTYTDVTVDTWSASWDQADVEDVNISENVVKKYTNLTFAGIEFTSQTVNASDMTHFRMDIWTPDTTREPAALRIKLVDFGADGVFGGGDDSEHEISLTAASEPTALATTRWVSFDIPLSEFASLAARDHLAQLIISGDPNTVFVDNVYLRR
ncbi:MAG: hypothetical protein F4X22_11180 [Gemmatimonadales bacterium]|nr:hypothetical protein [Candidatus Palauibacter denitrificans]